MAGLYSSSTYDSSTAIGVAVRNPRLMPTCCCQYVPAGLNVFALISAVVRSIGTGRRNNAHNTPAVAANRIAAPINNFITGVCQDYGCLRARSIGLDLPSGRPCRRHRLANVPLPE